MRLDLRQDFTDIYSYLAGRIRVFNPAVNHGPGESGLVARIDLGYGFDQDGWVAVVFDTRPNAEPDGEWNGYIEGNQLERTHWPAACEANEDEVMELMLPNGVERKLPTGRWEELAAVLGDLLKSVLLKARADGMFVGLQKARRCELGVEEQNGIYGWPAFEARGVENLAEEVAATDRPRD